MNDQFGRALTKARHDCEVSLSGAAAALRAAARVFLTSRGGMSSQVVLDLVGR